MNLTNLRQLLEDQPKYRLKQVYEAIYKQLVNDWSEAINLPLALRQSLRQQCPLEIKAVIFESVNAEKAAIEFFDGKKAECVLIRNRDGRRTVCVSSQIGCPVGCVFCATGGSGYQRNLTAEEIVEQVVFFSRKLKRENSRVDNVVFMGMGEPFLNTGNVLGAINLLNSQEGLNIGARSISISTIGVTEGIRQLAKFPLQVNLALSLHAPNDRLRDELVPLNKKYDIEKIWSALKYYLETTNRKIMIEYVMISGINDSEQTARELATLIDQLPKKLVMVNLIPYNPTGKFKASPLKQLELFKRILGKQGIEATIRESPGRDILGACGQLARKRS